MSDPTEELLLAGMARFTADVGAPAPGLAAKAVRHRRRRTFTATAATAGTVVIVAAVIAAVAGAARPIPAPAAATPAPVGVGRPGSQDAHTAAYLISRTESALGAVSDANFVERVQSRFSEPGVEFENVGPASGTTNYTMWMYGQRVKVATYTSGGQLATVSGWRGIAGWATTTAVDFLTRTWWIRPAPFGQSRYPEAKLPPCVAAANAVVQIDEPGSIGSGDVAAALRAALRCGSYTLDGTQRVDGVDTVELRLARSANTPVSETFWVDPVSYLPVRSLDLDYSVRPSPERTQTDFQWLQPTPANVAEVNVTIPAGFTPVPPPATP